MGTIRVFTLEGRINGRAKKAKDEGGGNLI